jgi:hypothetical protein
MFTASIFANSKVDTNVPALEATKRDALADVLSRDTRETTFPSEDSSSLLRAAEFRRIDPALEFQLRHTFRSCVEAKPV